MKTIRLHNPRAINYHLLITGALILFPFALALFKLAFWGVPESEPLRAMVLIATPTTMPTVTPTSVPVRALIGYWDLGNQPVALLEDQLDRVVGTAEQGRWVLLETAQGARVWVAAAQLPAGLPIASLDDYTPATAMPAAVQPPSVQPPSVQPPSVQPQAPQAPQAPVETATPCWGGVPLVYEGLAPCWQGVPFVVE